MTRLLGRLLDRSVVFSFDRTGFRRHARHFGVDSERRVRGERVLITGGTEGIGLAVAEGLLARGAHPEAWARDPVKGAHLERLGGTFRTVDLGDLEQVARAATAVEGPLAAVVLNAGAMPLERRLTPQGHELMWGAQVLGHLLLLRILRARQLLGSGTRVIWVSSGGMYTATLDLSDTRQDRRYQRHQGYANVKRAQVELAGVLAERWPEVPMASMHPGWVATRAVAHSMPWFHALTRPILRTPEQGADTIDWLICREEPWPSGRFWFDRRAVPEHLRSGTQTPPSVREALVEQVFATTDPFLEMSCVP